MKQKIELEYDSSTNTLTDAEGFVFSVPNKKDFTTLKSLCIIEDEEDEYLIDPYDQ